MSHVADEGHHPRMPEADRAPGDLRADRGEIVRSLRTYLIEVKGMDDPKNNKDVELGIYLGSDSLVLDAKGEVRRDTTQRISKDPRWQHIQDIDDVPEQTRKEFEHFFARYKDLEPGKFVNIEGWGNAAEAERIVQEGFTRLTEAGADHS